MTAEDKKELTHWIEYAAEFAADSDISLEDFLAECKDSWEWFEGAKHHQQ